jgi:hypothetical protein
MTFKKYIFFTSRRRTLIYLVRFRPKKNSHGINFPLRAHLLVTSDALLFMESDPGEDAAAVKIPIQRPKKCKSSLSVRPENLGPSQIILALYK